MNSKHAISLVAMFALAACTGGQQVVTQPPAPGLDLAEVSLADAARAVNQSLQNLNEIKRASLPPSKQLVSVSPYAMPGQASVDWSGPIEPLLRRIANMQGYRVVVLGKEPAIPVLVTVSVVDQAVVDILRDVDLQAGDKASLRVSSGKRLIELRYAEV